MGPGLEIASISDVPAGTGLSSSSAFTVGLLHALYRYNLQSINPRQLAEEACNIEIHTLNSPIGKQDQYAASFGGFNVFRFQKGKKVEVIPLKLSSSTRQNLKQHLRLYFLGSTRSTNTLLKRQNSLKNRKKKVILLKKMVEQVDILRKDLESNETNTIGPLLHETWIRKKELDQSISNSTIDEIYNKALSYGASGGKLLGAGGGGFFLLVHNDHDYLEKKLGLKTLTFDFDLKGSQLTNF
ncbi:uncharacterized protein LOC111347424 [Stylophora pistillata]|uniref:uncharacterized protein LOC111347424 n=1 Tax=Stylophora pistillata TaxID=50429 RepID=UPI000C0530EF|nr:uncharacterized protein LOC111347424 [Stylophora pistillata]